MTVVWALYPDGTLEPATAYNVMPLPSRFAGFQGRKRVFRLWGKTNPAAAAVLPVNPTATALLRMATKVPITVFGRAYIGCNNSSTDEPLDSDEDEVHRLIDEAMGRSPAEDEEEEDAAAEVVVKPEPRTRRQPERFVP